MDAEEGVVSPGGVGYDINCGVRLVALRPDAARTCSPRLRDIVKAMYRARADRRRRASARPATVAAGPRGCARRRRALGGRSRLRSTRTISTTSKKAGLLAGRRSGAGVGPRARAGTVAARHAGLGQPLRRAAVRRGDLRRRRSRPRSACARDQITVMIHSGSRGLGHQVCEDHLRVMIRAARKYGIELPDRQLCCAPVTSPEGRAYLAAMSAAANFAFANRQVMAHWVRESIAEAMGDHAGRRPGLAPSTTCVTTSPSSRTFPWTPHAATVCVHRKGATRAYPPGHPQTPADVPRCRAAGADPGRHGPLFVRAGRNRARLSTRRLDRPVMAPAGAGVAVTPSARPRGRP